MKAAVKLFISFEKKLFIKTLSHNNGWKFSIILENFNSLKFLPYFEGMILLNCSKKKKKNDIDSDRLFPPNNLDN